MGKRKSKLMKTMIMMKMHETGQEGAEGEEEAAGPGEEDDWQNAENPQDEAAGEGDAPQMELWEDYIAPVFPTADLVLKEKCQRKRSSFARSAKNGISATALTERMHTGRP